MPVFFAIKRTRDRDERRERAWSFCLHCANLCDLCVLLSFERFLCEFGRDKFSNFSLLPFSPSCLFKGGREGEGPHGIALQLRMESPAALFHHHPSFRLLPRCTSPATLLQAHSQLITTGLILHTYPLSRFLLPLSSLSKPLYAISVLRQSPRPSTFLFNVLISSFSDTFPLLSRSLYFELASSLPLCPNSHSYTSLLRICGSPNVGLPLHAHILKFVEHSPDPFVQAALLSFYCRCGKLKSPVQQNSSTGPPNLELYDICLHCQSRCSRRSLVSLPLDADFSH